MITYSINKNKDNIIFVEISGHAQFAEHGKDIVCSSVSTAVIMTINLIEKMELLSDIEYSIQDDGNVKIKVIKQSKTLNNILENLEFTLLDLKSQYSDYIQKL